MKFNTMFLVAVSALIWNTSAQAGDAVLAADAQELQNACSAEGVTANCAATTPAHHSWIHCLSAYKMAQKKTNKSFQYSAGCEAALAKRKADRKAGL